MNCCNTGSFLLLLRGYELLETLCKRFLKFSHIYIYIYIYHYNQVMLITLSSLTPSFLSKNSQYYIYLSIYLYVCVCLFVEGYICII